MTDTLDDGGLNGGIGVGVDGGIGVDDDGGGNGTRNWKGGG